MRGFYHWHRAKTSGGATRTGHPLCTRTHRVCAETHSPQTVHLYYKRVMRREAKELHLATNRAEMRPEAHQARAVLVVSLVWLMRSGVESGGKAFTRDRKSVV